MRIKTKLVATLVIGFLVVVMLAGSVNAAQEKQEETHLYFFYGSGCPYCSHMDDYLDSIKDDYPNLVIHKREVYNNDTNTELVQNMSKAYDKKFEGVPTLFIDDTVIIGAEEEALKKNLDKCKNKNCKDPYEVMKNYKGNNGKLNKLTIPIVIGAAAVDAINPCAFAVLIILMSAALAITNKKRALKFGLSFAVAIYISYFLMGLGLMSALKALRNTGITEAFYVFVIILALIVGALNIKDYFWYGKGFLMEVPLSWRPRMKKLLKGVTSPIGAFLIGFVVSLFELPCTGGPYIVILGLLAKEATQEVGIMYLLLYNLVFILPLIILSFLIYKGLASTEKLEKVRQKRIRLLHLIGGIIMIGIGITLFILHFII